MEKTDQFDHLLNFRDVGQTVNKRLESHLLVAGLLFRSARPDDTSTEDRRRLCHEFKIKTVIDLRTKSEHIKQLKLHGVDPAVATMEESKVANNGATVTAGLRIPGLEYRNINLNGGAYEQALFRRLSVWNQLKMLAMLFAGYRMEAISILAKEVLLPGGLTGLAVDSLDHAGNEIRQVFDILAEPSSYPVLVHCTQGKDRTGLVVALVLLLLQVQVDAIRHDYSSSELELLPEQDERIKEIREVGLTEDFIRAPPEWIDEVQDHIVQRYQSISAYLASIGVDRETQQHVQNILLAKQE